MVVEQNHTIPVEQTNVTQLKVQGSSRALAVQGEQGILGFSNPSYLTNPTKFYV